MPKTNEEKPCNAEKNGVKCRPPCKWCYGGENMTPSLQEGRLREDFLKEFEKGDYIAKGLPIIGTLEIFADYWLKVLAEQRKEWKEEVRREIETRISVLTQGGMATLKERGQVGLTAEVEQSRIDALRDILRLPSLTTDFDAEVDHH